MKTIIHKSDTRGKADHGWLLARHTFSFAGYYDPERVHFGTLRVLNDDTIAPGKGFGTHPHDNMEIVTIPLNGVVYHKDSMGNQGAIRAGEVQVMSAGSGITHSEFNGSNEEVLKLLQIWIFPNVKGVKPRYGQISLDELKVNDQFYEVISPLKEGKGLWLNSDTWFNIGEFVKENESEYVLKNKGNGLYIFVIEGGITMDDIILERRDGMGISDFERINFSIKAKSKILLIEVPMSV